LICKHYAFHASFFKTWQFYDIGNFMSPYPLKTPKGFNPKSSKKPSNWIKALAASATGDIFELDDYAAVGSDGHTFMPLKRNLTIPMPFGSELMYLPDRLPIVYNIRDKKFEVLTEDPYSPGNPIHPVSAFNSPGHLVVYSCAYQEMKTADCLPLFSYGAVGWSNGGFKTAAIRVDWERRQDIRLMKTNKVLEGIDHIRKILPKNRLRKHLEHCALEYGCPAGKNFFLGRYEAPLPTANQCNARCLGCLSLQSSSKIPVSQNRIAFTPSPEEIASVALTHIQRVKHAIVSFGQGCEGDPLMAAEVIEPAIRLIRSQTAKGTININTNASRPEIVKRLISAGLDSIRVSMNSVRKPCYIRYFRPKGYRFEDVIESIRSACDMGIFVSINYLNLPGFTDALEETAALEKFLRSCPIGMIQWRNLNYDPKRYLKAMEEFSSGNQPLGMKNLLEHIRKNFSGLAFGYFNPPKEKFSNH
jgi:pyruvate-formate lyase-activating enzyme